MYRYTSSNLYISSSYKPFSMKGENSICSYHILWPCSHHTPCSVFFLLHNMIDYNNSMNIKYILPWFCVCDNPIEWIIK